MRFSSPWWARSRHADRRPLLLARNRIKSAFRTWFEAEGFVEVEAACLQVSPGNEAHLHAFATDLVGSDGGTSRRYLHTSPEFACKKLVAAGETRIFTFAPVFRNREKGPLHHPEFTMLEWYRAGAPYHGLVEDCSALLQLAADVTGNADWSYRYRSANVRRPAKRITVCEAFARLAGIELTVDGLLRDGTPDRRGLLEAARRAGVRCADDDTWSDIFSRILVERIEPALASEPTPVVLDEYPAIEAALARRVPGDHRVSERFELYVAGVELANAFGELTDPAEQRRRFTAEMDERERIWGDRYPLDEDLLTALAAMPPTSGIALGFDRLVMLAAGAPYVSEVIWTPIDE